jgi:hypothetical protein
MSPSVRTAPVCATATRPKSWQPAAICASPLFAALPALRSAPVDAPSPTILPKLSLACFPELTVPDYFQAVGRTHGLKMFRRSCLHAAMAGGNHARAGTPSGGSWHPLAIRCGSPGLQAGYTRAPEDDLRADMALAENPPHLTLTPKACYHLLSRRYSSAGLACCIFMI